MTSRIAIFTAPFGSRLAGLGAAIALLLPVALATAPTASAVAEPPTTSSEGVSAQASPTSRGWIRGMNRILDKSGTFFIADYGDPGYYNWDSNECSGSPDNYPYGFKWACRRHDFGYRNLKRGEARYPAHNMWNRKNKAVVDRQFHEDLYTHCYVEHNSSKGCRNAADAYHGYVSRYVSFNTVGMNRHTLYRF